MKARFPVEEFALLDEPTIARESPAFAIITVPSCKLTLIKTHVAPLQAASTIP